MESSLSRKPFVHGLLIVLTVIITSLYLFPFEFTFARGANTKMVMAGVGLFMLLAQFARKGNGFVNNEIFYISLFAIAVSGAGLLSITYNGTNDLSYTTYIVSMWVWLSAANVVVNCIKGVHGTVSVKLVVHYLIAVCVMQCFLALLIDAYTPFKVLVNDYIGNVAGTVSTGNSLQKAGRIYGIGCALDVAGTRFTCVLIMIAYFVKQINYNNDRESMWGYLICFSIILVVGSSISRTTTAGALLGIAYWLYSFLSTRSFAANARMLIKLGFFFFLAVLVVIFLYNAFPSFHSKLRFAFEGFFNWVETGEWSTNSTNTLKEMYVFPETLKTWIIGDGYFDNPLSSDPYYTGKVYNAFYMGTDVGYLRFIFYFGLIGLTAFVIFFCKAAQICMSRLREYRLMFFGFLIANLAIWFKVSTDIFLIFALFLCILPEDEEEYNKLHSPVEEGEEES